MTRYALLAVLALAGCGLGPDMRESVHQTLPSTSAPVVRVTNVVGTIRVRSWDKSAVDVLAVKAGHSMDDLNRMRIDAHSEGGSVIVATRYAGESGGGGVEYTLAVPANASLAIENVTGTVDIEGVRGNVSATTQTGEIKAQLGRVSGNRLVELGATTGSVTLSVARDSSARIDVSTIVGSFSTDLPNISMGHANVVGVTASGSVGSGSATIRLHTMTGSIALRALR